MTERKFIFITTSFQGFHKYPGAKEAYKFLRDFHRHIFGVRVKTSVSHNDRDIEFIELKNAINEFIEVKLKGELYREEISCEDFADHIADFVREYTGSNFIEVEVNEDGENGAIIARRYSKEDN